MNQTVFNKDSFNNFSTTIKEIEPKNVFLLCDSNSYKISGAEEFINRLLPNKDYKVFSDFEPNPQISDLKKGIEIFKKGNFQTIIAIGGGSVIDMAKLISVFAHQNVPIEDIVYNKAELNNHKTSLVAIPTTAGTGAEATHFAVLYIDKSKYSVAHPKILPDYVFLSEDFSIAAPPYLTACTGLDALSQAIESVWSVNSTEESMRYALEAIETIWSNLPSAVHENNRISKSKLQVAAFLAGKAINITKTTAPHALSYAFTSYYNIPHGHAVALTLPFFLDYNYNVTNSDCTDPKGSIDVKKRIELVHKAIQASFQDAKVTLVDFIQSLGVEMKIDKLIENFDVQTITNNVNLERLKNNPRTVSQKIIEDFLQTK